MSVIVFVQGLRLCVYVCACVCVSLYVCVCVCASLCGYVFLGSKSFACLCRVCRVCMFLCRVSVCAGVDEVSMYI